MSPFNLVQVLAKDIRVAVKDFKFEAEYQPDKKITVYEQYLEKSRFEQDTFYPLVIVELLGIDDDERESTASFVITCGVYCGEDDGQKGWADLFNMLEAIRLHLLTHDIIGGRLSLQLPVAMEFVQNQPYPFAFGSIGVQYKIFRPNNPMKYDF